jgi:hypothetical protein
MSRPFSMVNMQTSNRESATMEVIISQKNLNVPINSATCSPHLLHSPQEVGDEYPTASCRSGHALITSYDRDRSFLTYFSKQPIVMEVGKPLSMYT